ncbi:Uncharacterised protein [Mycobacteroides abscessus subsp. abscessus]|nr:Uncharacterised protein [Mycobacteroides abscessus subsp. abscessus]
MGCTNVMVTTIDGKTESYTEVEQIDTDSAGNLVMRRGALCWVINRNQWTKVISVDDDDNGKE